MKYLREKTGIRITPQILRGRFACEDGQTRSSRQACRLFCGRVLGSVLARHNTGFNPEKLKEI
jgi:hypothetical protein